MPANLIPAQVIRQVLSSFQSRQEALESFIQTLVEIESPSGNAAASRSVVDVIAQAAEQLDCVSSVERVDLPDFGQHLVIEAFPQQQQAGQILLVGHTDTVHEVGTLDRRPWRREGN